LIEFPLVTKRLRLRPLVPSDAEQLDETLSHPTTLAAIGLRPPWTLDDTYDSIDRRMREQREHGISMWAMIERATGRVVGICGLQPVGHEGPEVEIGWHVHPDLRGLGYATEAATAALAAGLHGHGLDGVVALTHERNRSSQRVMEKIGLEYVCPTDYYGAGTVVYATPGSGWRGTGTTAPSAENVSGSREPGSTTTPSSGSPTQQA
jgi:RimJ/RimL family protein N-acetyltransferase